MSASPILNISLHSGLVEHFHREWLEGTLILSPEFQRSNQVWDKTRKSRLIESLLVGFPVPPIFLTDTDTNNREVVDGLQRLTAIFEFLDGQFALKDMEFTAKLNGQKFTDLSESIQARISRASISFYVLPSDSKYWGGKLKHIVFDRLNQGVPVNMIERIMGTHPGEGNSLVTSATAGFSQLWEGKSKALQRRGKDTLYTLTGLSAAQLCVGAETLELGGWQYKRGGKNPWEAFLTTSLKQLNQMDDASRKDLADQLNEALDIVSKVFDHPFQSWDPNRGSYGPGIKDAAIVAQVWGFARPSNLSGSQWLAKKAEIEQAWRTHCETHAITHQANTLFASLKAWGEALDAITA